MRRFVISVTTVVAIAAGTASGALADRNPAGTGQPGTANPNGVACGDPGATSMPPGFSSPGFANASQHYAGSPLNPNASGNSHAVAEYDIACYQHTQNAPH
jgi:hypothetical protein